MVGPGSLLRVGAGPAADTLAAAKLRSFRAGVFSADSRLIALTTLSGPSDRAHRAAVVEVATGATVRELPLRSNANLAFHPDGRSLAAADCDGLAFLDLATGREFARRKAHAPHPGHAHLPFARVLLYFLDGSRLVTGHADTTALVWDAPRRPVAVTGPDEGARAAAWDDLASADGAKGWSAVWAPADDPGGTGFLRGRVRPAEPLPGKEFDALLGELDGDDFATRSAAARKLEAAGERAVGQLRARWGGTCRPSSGRRSGG